VAAISPRVGPSSPESAARRARVPAASVAQVPTTRSEPVDRVRCLCCFAARSLVARLATGLVALCILEAALAALQRHYAGIVAGLVTMGVAWYVVAATRIGQQAASTAFTAATFLAIALACYIIGLIGVRFASGVLDSSLPFRAFPPRCPADRGCARVAFGNPSGTNGVPVLWLAADASQVATAALSRLNAEPQAYRVSPASDEPAYLQYVWLSLFWGFPDDIAVKIDCNSTLTTVQVHSQQRLGTNDFGQNRLHVEQILTLIESEKANFVQLPCLLN